jgi:hypothetical protein
MLGLFDIKSFTTAIIITIIGFMFWSPLFYITPVVSVLLSAYFFIKMLNTDSAGDMHGFFSVIKYLFIPSVISILYILITHIRFV